MKPTIFIIILSMYSVLSFAHKPSDSYLSISNIDNTISANWSIALRDLEYAIGLDINQDSHITWRELQQKRAAIEAYVLSRLSFTDQSDQTCRFSSKKMLVESKTDRSYVFFVLTTPCQSPSIKLDYHLFFDIDSSHRGLISYTHNNNTMSRVASPESPGHCVP